MLIKFNKQNFLLKAYTTNFHLVKKHGGENERIMNKLFKGL